jgi:hypothetical protein
MLFLDALCSLYELIRKKRVGGWYGACTTHHIIHKQPDFRNVVQMLHFPLIESIIYGYDSDPITKLWVQ